MMKIEIDSHVSNGKSKKKLILKPCLYQTLGAKGTKDTQG